MAKHDDGGPAFHPPMGACPKCQTPIPMHKPMRQYAAIELRVPNSGVDWLDDMIRDARLMDFAGQALVGLVAQSYTDEECWAAVGEDSYKAAALMLAEKRRREENPNG